MEALRNADKAGDVAAAKRFAEMIRGGQFDQAEVAPINSAANVPVPLVEGMQGYEQQQASQQKQYASIQKPSFIDKAIGAGEAGTGLLLGAVPAIAGHIAGSVRGIGGEALGGLTGRDLNNGKSAEDYAIEYSQAAAKPFMPVTPTGQEYMQKTGETLGALDPTLAVGAPRAAAVSKPAIQSAESAVRNEAAILAPNKSAKSLDIINKIRQGSTENSLAPYELKISNPNLKDARGNLLPQAYSVIDDAIAKKAIGQEWEAGTVQAVKNLDPKSATIARRMLEVANRGTKDDTFKANNRPISELGDEIATQLDYIRKINRESGAAINEAAQALRNEKVDVTPAVDRFISSISDDLGVNISPRKEGVTIDFRGSYLEGNTPEIRSAQGVVKNLVNRMYNTKAPSAYDVHRLKGYIDTQASYGSQMGGLKGNTDRIVKNLRHDLDTLLDDNFPAYNQANTVYADTKTAIDAMQELVGKKIDLRKDYAPQAIGKLSRRMLSNAQSAERVREAALNINDVASRYGAEGSGNIPALVKFADTLDKQFGIAADTSLASEVAKGVMQSKKEAALNVGSAIIQKAKGINNERKYQSMSDLLNRQRAKRSQESNRQSNDKQIKTLEEANK